MRYSVYPQNLIPKKAIVVRGLLESDIAYLPNRLANVILCSKADYGISLVAYEPYAESPTFYGVLLCKSKFLDNEIFKGRGIELIEYSSTDYCNPHIFLRLLRKIVANTIEEDGRGCYEYVYGSFRTSDSLNRMKSWYGFLPMKGKPRFLYQRREKIIEILEQNENV